MSDFAKDAWRKYLIQLQAHPLRTKVVLYSNQDFSESSNCSDDHDEVMGFVKVLFFFCLADFAGDHCWGFGRL